MITTIKLNKNTKSALDNLKKQGQTYDEIVHELIQEKQASSLREQLIQVYKQWNEEDQKEFDEWDAFEL